MKDFERLSLSIHGMLLKTYETISLPTHVTLEGTFKFSLILLACSVLSTLLGFYTFISWQGCLICVVLLTILLFIERSENDALLRMYRTARLSAEKALRRAASAGTGIRGNNRSSDVSSPTAEEVGERE